MFNSFEALKVKHGLEQSDFYRYLQVRHYFSQHLSTALRKEETGVMKVILSATNSESCNKVISKLHNGILQPKSANTWYIKDKWEKEGSFTISEESWTRMCQIQWNSTCSPAWREFCWKNIVRFFITPLQKKTPSVQFLLLEALWND